MWQNGVRPCGKGAMIINPHKIKKKKPREMTSGINLAILKADE